MGKIHAKKIETQVDYTTGTGTFSVDMDLKNGLLMGLELTWGRLTTEPTRKEVRGMIDYLASHLIEVKSIEPTKKPHRYRISYSAGAREGETQAAVERQINEYLSTDFVTLVISRMNRTTDSFLEHVKLREEKMKRELKKAKRGTYKKSGHLIDQTLKYSYPKGGIQVDIFDTLQEPTKDKIRREVDAPEAVVEGLQLSPMETKVVDSLCKMLHHGSETKKPKERGYYAGNTGAVETTRYGTGQATEPRLAFTYYELAKEVKGGDAPSGRDIDNVKEVVSGLLGKKFLIRLKAVEWQWDKKTSVRVEKEIEEFRPIIRELKLTQRRYEDETLRNTRQEVVVALDPIFSFQIDSKFILCPDDLNKRTALAYGGHKITEAVVKLRDYLMRSKSGSVKRAEITEERLYWMLQERYMKEGRIRKTREAFEKAVDTCMRLGLLQSWERMQAKNGENKIVFHLNMAWE